MNFINIILTVIVAFLLITGAYSQFVNTSEPTTPISLSALANDIERGKVTSLNINGDQVIAKYVDKSLKTTQKENDASFTESLLRFGVSVTRLATTTITVNQPSGLGYWLAELAPFLAPVIFLVFFIWLLSRQVKGAGMQALSFGQSKARITMPDDKKQKVTFKDIAGAKEAKQELLEIVDFLKNPKKFIEIGAEIPKGVLLMGAPGTGKTLLARAVAGEANVAFFAISGSEFVEMFVGVGASRVRDLFKMAKQTAPAIVFVDEIDAVGRARGSGMGGGNDEREQTLNQILVEMDGFEPNEKVIVMAATNRPDVLDPALLRPGRFDRRVVIDLPDRGDREEILKIHAAKKQLAEDVNLNIVAERTPGFSGADLASLMNEAAILAAREDRAKIGQFDLIRSIEKVMLGPERRSHILSAQEKEITAYHEAGHAIIASVLPYADPVHKISIISRGRAAGYTLKLPLEDKKLQSRKEFLDDIAVSLGGYVAERMIYDDFTTGASNDLQVATTLARAMVTQYGMSEKIGPVALESPVGKVLFGQGVTDRDYSEKVAAEIDAEVTRIMTEARMLAEKTLKQHEKIFEIVAQRLVEKETIERDEYESLITAQGIVLKKKVGAVSEVRP
ncbi:MAG: cell division protein FtsH [Candidatus Taylorbacteria bacterium RIFCSPHIGHO2_02_FULL_45_28]|uniref:ATP-dependent zinc metalloprotease FtsH n=1 Tax=Candidatus Taylorbacteria bacterium RIFCSPHIGHO2_12_FULL_45_16 TaxID=1802315 RepID=A0A1G2N106_9BACT|nr:MAG: cell division protein FtsH [Candidatus Taylorbacteria bacterium RIFCSPHIGHO2_01_FULL_44_110]OHA25017.1 MAG: cell division protein FtsH [Candidatus Taylorbacteria bacterium RIFCSPHIGHO2_02_FULL_45_28]OHA29846.1 MAG: cell division protein FtsH [Candidatus Taylorbacteria bacterium RIFCSPHIGHO2_12_FULL_45_16]OHA32788.1 MAG: cell division protein FtsH [Candidatus Taylorbacteria bacterium RIFCSPLOWO2_01_FULL_45_59]OHA44615.1 MAG: cell division protein FtsH [Candidatus Taylorbacteria bacterium